MNMRAVESGENRGTRPRRIQKKKGWRGFQAIVVAEKSCSTEKRNEEKEPTLSPKKKSSRKKNIDTLFAEIK